MSDAYDSQMGVDDEIGPEGGAADIESSQAETPPEPPRQYLDIDDDIGSRYVRVRVDGEDDEIPLSEALSGYSRTADYTRKTQELAQQRQEAEYALMVQRALDANPRETLRLLADRYNVDGLQPPAQQVQQPVEDDEDLYADPLERRLNQMEQQFQQVQTTLLQRQADEQLAQAVGSLKQRYSIDDTTVREVVGTALQMGAGPEAFDLIYRGMAYDRLAAQQQAAQQQTAARQADDAVRTAAKAGLGTTITAGGGTIPPPEAAEASDGTMSLRDAFEAAWADLERRHA